MLVMCGCVGQSGGGWSHYVGQEKLRPQSGWLPLPSRSTGAARRGSRTPPHSSTPTPTSGATRRSTWRDRLADGARPDPWDGALIDYNVRAERMGWLPVGPAARGQSARVAEARAASGKEPKDYVAGRLKSGELKLSCHDPDNPRTGRATCSCGAPICWAPPARATSIFSSTCSAPSHGVMGKQLGEMGGRSPTEVVWHDEAPKESSTCWSHSISACRPPASTPTSCCRPPPGTRRTTSTPPTCTPSSIR
jgi:nitrate reductase alpha subunit